MPKPSEMTVHMVGHGHIDPTWLWRWTEGYEEVRATFRSALDRMNETPGFKFTSSSACFYAWVKAVDPEMFAEIQARVAEGRWEIAGGWWVEPDCNIPGGESFARHGLYSQRFFEKEFGKRVRVGFNPDSFGHAGTLPQIFKKMGIDRYVYMRPCPVHEMHYPEGTTFIWRANDGSEIHACNLQGSYNANENIASWARHLTTGVLLNPGQENVLGFFGVGNHGGGPTKRAIAEILELQGAADMPEVRFSTLMEFFDAFLAEKDTTVPVIARDLQHHARGCYSVHSEIKALNRSCEHALMSAERFAAAAWLLEDRPYPGGLLEGAWKDLLYNQFHDILAGTSLESSYQDSRDQMGAARHKAHTVMNEACQRIARSIDTTAEGNTVVVFNPLPWPSTQTIRTSNIVDRELAHPLHFTDASGDVITSQRILSERIGGASYAFTAELPALGYRCFHARPGAKSAPRTRMLEASRTHLENEWWRIAFDPYEGHICQLYDKTRGIEVMKKGNVLACMVDQSDTWSHGYDEWRVEAGRFGAAKLEVLEAGDVLATVRITQTFDKSTADTRVTLYRDSDTIDCEFRIDWRQRYTMLKLGYETHIGGGQAFYDTAYGAQERNTHGFEEPGQAWFDLSGRIGAQPYGLTVLNDSKYGFDARDGVMRVTMLRSPAYAHHDRARYDSSLPYSIMDQGAHVMKIRLAPHEGAWNTRNPARKAWELNAPAFAHVESAHAGVLGPENTFLGVDADNVLLSVLKRSEEGGALIIRGYETRGADVETVLRLPHWGKTWPVAFKAHEIKTLRVNPADWSIAETSLLE